MGTPASRRGAGQLLGRVEQRVELLAGHAEHDAPVHGDEAAVGVVGEPLVVGLAGQALHRLVVEAQVEDGVHHPGHGELGPGPHRDEQRVVGVADPLAHGLLQAGPGPGDLGGEPLGPAALHVGPARGGGDGEPGGHGQAQHGRHLGQVGTLAAEEVLHLHRGLAVGVVEVEDERHREGSPRMDPGQGAVRARPVRRPASLPPGHPSAGPPEPPAEARVTCVRGSGGSRASRAPKATSRSRSPTDHGGHRSPAPPGSTPSDGAGDRRRPRPGRQGDDGRRPAPATWPATRRVRSGERPGVRGERAWSAPVGSPGRRPPPVAGPRCTSGCTWSGSARGGRRVEDRRRRRGTPRRTGRPGR